jgi:beta-lactamase class D
VKKIIINGRTPDYVLRAKTGWAQTKTIDLGWWVGYIEMKSGVYFFATRVQNPLNKNPLFAASRMQVSRKIFEDYFGISFDQTAEK